MVKHDMPLRVLLVQAHPRPALAQDAGQGGLAHFDRLPAQVVTAQLNLWEGTREATTTWPER
jgi:hypothetical protein